MVLQRHFFILSFLILTSIPLWGAQNVSSGPISAGIQIVSFNFDWDDNIMFMPTKIILFNKSGDPSIEVTTKEFAEIRDKVGTDFQFKGRSLKNYFISRSDKKNSFIYFRGDYFKKHIIEALSTQPTEWLAPSLYAFIFALSTSESARHTSIITARGHSPQQTMDGLKYFQRWLMENWEIRIYLPPIESLHGVSGRSNVSAANPSEAKAIIAMQNLDEIQRVAITSDMIPVVDQDGINTKPLHLWGFSDDDKGNQDSMTSKISEAIKANPSRWSNIKIVIFDTSPSASHESAAGIPYVMTSKGELRNKIDGEDGESQTIMKLTQKLPIERACLGAGLN